MSWNLAEGCEQSHFLLRFGSFVAAKMRYKGENSTSFGDAKLGEFAVKYSDVAIVEVDILCHTLAFFSLRRLLVIFRERS